RRPCGGPLRAAPSHRTPRHVTPDRTGCSGRRTPSCGCADRSSALVRATRHGHRRFPALTLLQRAVLAEQQIEVNPLLLGEFQEHLLALGVLEPLAVFLEELVRAALAFDPDEQRLLIVDALAKLF